MFEWIKKLFGKKTENPIEVEEVEDNLEEYDHEAVAKRIEEQAEKEYQEICREFRCMDREQKNKWKKLHGIPMLRGRAFDKYCKKTGSGGGVL